MDLETLEREIERLRTLASICEKHGELDGKTAAWSQLRALEKERREILNAGG